MNDNKKIAFNSIIIFFRLIVVTVVSLIASRVILDLLGASDYGLYNVVGGMVTFLNVFNTAMTSTTYRYIAFEMGKGENGNTNKVFNTSFMIHLFFAGLIFLLGFTVGDWYINNYLNVESVKLPDARFVFHISLFTASISTILVPFQGLLVACEKFSVTAIIEIAVQILRLLLILVVLPVVAMRLRTYSLIMLLVTLLTSLSFFMYCRIVHADIVKYRFSNDKHLYKEMIGFAWWTLFGALANVGKTQGSAIVINFFFGSMVNAAFAIGCQVERFVLLFSRSLNNAAIPQITKKYSSGDSGRSIKLTSYISKYTFIMMSLVAFPVILDMDFLLGIWLKQVPEGTTSFCQLLVLGALFGCLGEGIPALVNATGKIRSYQIVVQTILLSGLPIAIVCYHFGAQPVTISVIYCFINLFLGLVKLIMLKRVVQFDIKIFLKVSYLKILLISLPLVLFYFFYNPSGLSAVEHFVWMLIMELFLLADIWFLGTDGQERALIKGYINSKVQKKR